VSTVDLTTPHQATLTVTGLPPVSSLYSHVGTGWPNVDGWAASSGVSIDPRTFGLRVEVTGSSGTYVSHSVGSTAGTSDMRRVRARVRLFDPEARPALVRVTDQANSASTGEARLVSGDPVVVEGYVNLDGTTAVRIYVTKPAGAAETVLVVEDVWFDRVTAHDWFVRRTDGNGVTVIADAATGPDPDATGELVLVDAEAALVGSVSWFVERDGFAADETLTGTLATTGYAVMHQVHADALALLPVFLVDFRGRHAARTQPLEIGGAAFPVVPLAPLSRRQGSLVLYFDTLDHAQTVADVLASGEVVQLRQPVENRLRMDAYLVATDVEVSLAPLETAQPKWQLTASYVETARGA
jgi:hypothetical protein